MLLHAGEIVYFGDVSDAVNYYTKAGFPCPDMTNPADHFSKNNLSF
jgi:hypothetical protein